jgi:hypothetical protein
MTNKVGGWDQASKSILQIFNAIVEDRKLDFADVI